MILNLTKKKKKPGEGENYEFYKPLYEGRKQKKTMSLNVRRKKKKTKSLTSIGTRVYGK